MRLEYVTAKIRPRSRWESIDLGCAMARRSYGSILLAWMVCVWPLWAAGVIGLGYLCEGGWHLFWSFVWIWFSLGIGGRLPLHVVSRELFGEKVTAWQVIKLWPKMLVQNLWTAFTSRLSMTRGLSLPVSQLEGLKGSAYRSRVALLSRNGGDGASQAGMVSLLMVLVIVASCWFFIMMVYQFYGENDLLERLFEDLYLHGDDYSNIWLMLLFYCIGLTLIEPLYIGAGFAIYVNSRTMTEGWDIELSFKRLSERLRANFKVSDAHKAKSSMSGKGMLLLMLSFFLFTTVDSLAETAKERVDRITSKEEYTVHQRQEKVYESSSSFGSSSSSGSSHSRSSSSSGGNGWFFLEGISQVIFFGLLAFLIGLVIWVIMKNKHALNKVNSLSEPDDISTVKSVMGMDVTPESLPKALSDEAREAWLRGDHHAAMSLLYRGAISWMVNQGRVPIVESDTENDCVRRVLDKQEDIERGEFFECLTHSWVNLAYGKSLPADSVVLDMCDRWPFEKGGKQ